jgi:hypothetical protein
MNRHLRRAAKAKGSIRKLDRVVAIHEAGHAVARVMVAADFGLPTEKMVSYIDVGTAQSVGQSYFDKSVKLVTQATTYGPTLSVDLQSVFDRTVKGLAPASLTKKHIIDALAYAKSEGIDLLRWLRARMLISTLASAAEAKHTGRSIDEVWNSLESEDDLKGAVEDGVYAGIPHEQIGGFIDEALERSKIIIEQEKVQCAILALADVLPDQGRMAGRRAVFVINQALAAAE